MTAHHAPSNSGDGIDTPSPHRDSLSAFRNEDVHRILDRFDAYLHARTPLEHFAFITSWVFAIGLCLLAPLLVIAIAVRLIRMIVRTFSGIGNGRA